MTQMIPAMIMGFREGLEAFLVIALILRYLKTIGEMQLRGKAYQGGVAGILGSIALGLGLYMAASTLGGVSTLSKAWESMASLAALALVTTFIIWMIRHGSQMTIHVKEQVSSNLSATGIFLIAFAMVMREGTEIAIFSFAGKYSLVAVFLGISAAAVLAFLIYHSLIKVRINLLFQITLAYLILQAGFLLGYSVHEGLSALKGYGVMAGDSIIYTKVFNLSTTVLDHKTGLLGLPLNVGLGWYSKPEWIQFLVQYIYTGGMLFYWFRHVSSQVKAEKAESTNPVGHTALPAN
jgi:high-affinity iron transporter